MHGMAWIAAAGKVVALIPISTSTLHAFSLDLANECILEDMHLHLMFICHNSVVHCMLLETQSCTSQSWLLCRIWRTLLTLQRFSVAGPLMVFQQESSTHSFQTPSIFLVNNLC